MSTFMRMLRILVLPNVKTVREGDIESGGAKRCPSPTTNHGARGGANISEQEHTRLIAGTLLQKINLAGMDPQKYNMIVKMVDRGVLKIDADFNWASITVQIWDALSEQAKHELACILADMCGRAGATSAYVDIYNKEKRTLIMSYTKERGLVHPALTPRHKNSTHELVYM